MFARIHMLETSREQYEDVLRIVRDDLLPWVRNSSGFHGLIGLTDHEGQTLVITLWSDADTLAASERAAKRLGDLTNELSGARRLSLTSYEVTLFELHEPVAQLERPHSS